MDLIAFGNAMSKLTLDELRDVQRIACNHINLRHEDRRESLRDKFKRGDLIEFKVERGAMHGLVRARIDRLNDKTIGCTDIATSRTWRVAYSLARLVGADKPPAVSTLPMLPFTAASAAPGDDHAPVPHEG